MFSASIFRLAPLCFAVSGLLASSVPGADAQQVQYSSAHSSTQRALPQTLNGGSKALRAKLATSRRGISLAVADVDGDGSSDLLTGYAAAGGGAFTLQRGSKSATAPSASDWAAMQRGELVSPFSENAEVTELPVQPDFLKAADIDGNGTVDVVVAAQGGHAAYVLFGDGQGGFSQPQALPVQGTITVLNTLRTADGPGFIVAGVCGGAGCSLQVMAKDGSVHASLALPASASAVEAVTVNGHTTPDLAVVAGGQLLLADGPAIEAGAATFETLPVSHAAAVTAGSFVFDRRPYAQLAVLDSAGTLHVLARPGVDSHAVTHAEYVASRQRNHTKAAPAASPSGLGWTEVETVNGVGSAGSSTPLLLRGRLTGSGGDDLLVLSGSQYVTVRHAIDTSSATVTTTPSVTIDSTSGSATAAVALRVSPDARQGVVIADGSATPNVAPTLPTVNKTYTVNSTNDTFDTLTTAGRCTTGGITCSLRDAIDLANNDAASNISAGRIDTVNVPTGKYSLTLSGSYTDFGGDATYHIEITGPVNIVGAGAGSTIIDAEKNDKIFSINFGLNAPQVIFDTFISGVTLQDAKNSNNFNPPTFAQNYFAGIMDWDSFGGGYLTITNSTLQTSTAMWGPGGAIVGFNTGGGGTGTVELDSCTVTANSTPEEGGGIYLENGVPTVSPLILNATTISNNQALLSVNSGDGGGLGEGGGVYTLQNTSSVETAIINGSVISGNQATSDGGGVWASTGLLISASSFTGNIAGDTGGGLYVDPQGTTATITSGTFTGNSAKTDGGGLFLDSGVAGNVLNMHYSRIHSNTNSTHSGLGVGSAGVTPAATANATDNWWGCNGAATGTGCDVAGAIEGTLTVSPYTTLTLSLNSTTPAAGSTIIATGSLGQDSNGTIYTTAQDVAYFNVPATLTIVQGSSTTNSTAAALNSSAAIVTTATATATGIATVTVDGTSASKNFTVTVPVLSVNAIHSGNFIAGSTGNTYTLTVTNTGTVSTSGTVTVVDTLPSGFTATAMSGTGWSCTLATATCTNGTAIAGGGSSVITLTVSVSGADLGSYTNSVTVSGGGAVTASGTNPTIVVGPPLLSAAFSPATSAINQNVVLSFTFTNPNTAAALTGLTLADTLPSGLVIGAPAGVTDTCNGTVTATSGSSSITLLGGTIAAGATCTLSLNVIASAAGTYVDVTAAPGSSGGVGNSATATLTIEGSLWVINANGTVDHLSQAGTQIGTAGTAGTIGTLGAVAFDSGGDVWAVQNGTSAVTEFTSSGTAVGIGGSAAAGVNTPVSLAVDGLGQIWVANGNNSVSVLSTGGAAVTPSTGYQGGGLSTPAGIVIDNSGSVWIPNRGNNSVTKIIGGAAPVVTPTVTGTTNNTLGTRP
jgi:trimeric autotransporter adhesin